MAKAAKMPESFESGLTELESLITALESGNAPLEDSLAKYQRGVELLRFCEGKLADAEQRVRVLEGAELKPFNSGEGS
ncbi:Exodeoxyribonuclease VII small subunit [Formivibrio citricus]|uniref:Exodeoxyribonuclease 7 small subunit n=1 Tax=Formivibrio citricus TaxID=83765 RepID=A0A1I5BK95_9NEIS|nr:exodeoxyribonuclease VII small subunit [Formivibrio citricus]SFN75175.1 Exodeoxyribonuclease VII small subunit [Formivibrio citricus]